MTDAEIVRSLREWVFLFGYEISETPSDSEGGPAGTFCAHDRLVWLKVGQPEEGLPHVLAHETGHMALHEAGETYRGITHEPTADLFSLVVVELLKGHFNSPALSGLYGIKQLFAMFLQLTVERVLGRAQMLTAWATMNRSDFLIAKLAEIPLNDILDLPDFEKFRPGRDGRENNRKLFVEYLCRLLHIIEKLNHAFGIYQIEWEKGFRGCYRDHEEKQERAVLSG